MKRKVYRRLKKNLSNKLDKWMKEQGDPGADISSFEELNKAAETILNGF